jgi:hypothetical protein
MVSGIDHVSYIIAWDAWGKGKIGKRGRERAFGNELAEFCPFLYSSAVDIVLHCGTVINSKYLHQVQGIKQ